MTDSLELWERAARQDERLVPPHRQASLAPSTPADRIIELTRLLKQTREYLAEACVEIRRLQR